MGYCEVHGRFFRLEIYLPSLICFITGESANVARILNLFPKSFQGHRKRCLASKEDEHTIMLCDLIACGKIRVKVMFPIEGGAKLNLRVESDSRPERQIYTFWVQVLAVDCSGCTCVKLTDRHSLVTSQETKRQMRRRVYLATRSGPT